MSGKGQRISIDFSEEASAELDRLQQVSGAKDVGQMTVGAVKLFREVVNAQAAGKRVVLHDPQTGEMTDLPPVAR